MFSASCCDYYDSYTVSFTSSESTMHVNCQYVQVLCDEMHLRQCEPPAFHARQVLLYQGPTT